MEKNMFGWRIEYPDNAKLFFAYNVKGSNQTPGMIIAYATNDANSISSIQKILGKELDNKEFKKISGGLSENFAKTKPGLVVGKDLGWYTPQLDEISFLGRLDIGEIKYLFQTGDYMVQKFPELIV